MAAAMTAAQSELVSSLAQEEIPIKLRCAICSRLAVNAFRLPCCDQAICETCQSTLPSSCPVCEHTPVAAEDCKPHKSLRTTIKVFLRTEEKKREALRVKEAKNTPPDTPQEEVPPAEGEPPSELPTRIEDNASIPPDGSQDAEVIVGIVLEHPANPAEIEAAQEAAQDIPQPSIEEITPGQEPTDADAHAVMGTGETDTQDMSEALDQGDAQPADGQSIQGTGASFDASGPGGFTNMPFGTAGDFNQMQMMMAMQNGMSANGFGNFPMMGMPGMNMDPMTMQSMFMNGGFGAGMGMSGMNIGMGMGGFDGGGGAGFNGAWNQQQSWNVGPDNFNHPNAAGMGHGDYGANNSGYPQHATGFAQGNYGRGNQFNDFQNNHYGNQSFRGRGRGRGSFMQGRGGFAHGQNDMHSQQYPQQFSTAQIASGPNESGSVPTEPKADSTPSGNVDEFGREIRPVMETDEDGTAERASKDNTGMPVNESAAENIDGKEASHDTSAQTEDDGPKPIQTLDEMQAASYNVPMGPAGLNPMSSLDPNARIYGHTRGGFAYNHRGRGGFGMQPPPVKSVPINAPTGPKAMREGLPNTGLSSLRGRTFSGAGRVVSRPVTDASVAPPSVAGSEHQDRVSRSPSLIEQESRSPSRSRSRERRLEKDKDKEREDKHRRKHRHRSTSRSKDERESERRRERRRERRSRHQDDELELNADNDEEKGVPSTSDHIDHEDGDDQKSRSASPAHSSRRSRRDRDKDRYRERERDSDKDREHKSSHRHRSSHRSHREDRSRSRERDRDRDHRHSRRHDSRRGSPEAENKDNAISSVESRTKVDLPHRKPSNAVANGIEIKGVSSRKTLEVHTAVQIPTGPSKDRINITSSRDKDRDRERPSRHYEERHRSSRHHERTSDRHSTRERERDSEKEKTKVESSAPTRDPHTLEREARDRERLLKEAQRIAGFKAGVGQKRGRDDLDDGASGRKGRKKGRRGAIIAEENEEDRIARTEAEREISRWD
ncbi:hypothetical protein BP6252_12732 [Coleophoma cylindrospora]|uniref:RING-type domain-containing protein n=1 Tax=Coleophoma cylindrospora TaxID=1849047 RepID=A0A3D8QCR3_9HELO|nr:hypothetical protein BP6252_12732 [Coleophoma cylindrospora]